MHGLTIEDVDYMIVRGPQNRNPIKFFEHVSLVPVFEFIRTHPDAASTGFCARMRKVVRSNDLCGIRKLRSMLR